MVSELLRERLGPTSEYVSSLIQIQAAYINTNHPDFQAGSAAIARGGAPSSEPVAKVPLHHNSAPENNEDSSSSSEGAQSVPNGYVLGHHPRSASASVPDGRRPQIKDMSASHHEKSTRHHRAASNFAEKQPPNHLLPPTIVPPGGAGGAGGSSHTAKETFLNYFFGGPNGVSPVDGPASQAPRSTDGRVDRNRSSKPPPSAFNRDVLPDLGSRRRGGSKDGVAAYDMKSLGKHIEAVSATTLSPSSSMMALMGAANIVDSPTNRST